MTGSRTLWGQILTRARGSAQRCPLVFLSLHRVFRGKDMSLLPTQFCHSQFHRLFLAQTSAKVTSLDSLGKKSGSVVRLKPGRCQRLPETRHRTQLQVGPTQASELARRTRLQLSPVSFSGAGAFSHRSREVSASQGIDVFGLVSFLVLFNVI